jgi:hypothetical protein
MYFHGFQRSISSSNFFSQFPGHPVTSSSLGQGPEYPKVGSEWSKILPISSSNSFTFSNKKFGTFAKNIGTSPRLLQKHEKSLTFIKIFKNIWVIRQLCQNFALKIHFGHCRTDKTTETGIRLLNSQVQLLSQSKLM